MTYTNYRHIQATRTTTAPRSTTRSGYGGKLPTQYLVLYHAPGQARAMWRRVYVMCWSNAGTPYILVDGERHVLDTETEHRLMDL